MEGENGSVQAGGSFDAVGQASEDGRLRAAHVANAGCRCVKCEDRNGGTRV